MANTIKIKRSVPPSTDAPTELARGELAYQENTQLLFIGSGTETDGLAANIITLADEVTSARPCDGTGSQVSTDVSLAGTPDYITLATQTLTLGQIDLAADVTGDLPDAEIASAATWNAKHTPGTTLAMGDTRITGLATPTASTDAATKAYVDATKAGLDVKDSVRVASQDAISTVLIANQSSLYVIDGVTTALDDRVLLKCQAGAANHAANSVNGIYTVKAQTPSGYQLIRATDFDADIEVTSGAFTFIEEGTVNSDSGWVLTTNDAITVGTTALAFTQFSGAGQIVAGSGIKKTANTLSVLLHSSGGVDLLDQGGTDKLAVDLGATNIINTLADGKIASAATWNGKQDALTFGIGDTNVLKCGDAVADDDFLRIDGTTIEGRTAAQTLGDIGAAASDHSHAVGSGGTGLNTLLDGAVMLGNGTNSVTMLAKVAAGQLLTSGGTAGGDEAVWSDTIAATAGLTIDCGTF